jgi:hypothetical protein
VRSFVRAAPEALWSAKTPQKEGPDMAHTNAWLGPLVVAGLFIFDV